MGCGAGAELDAGKTAAADVVPSDGDGGFTAGGRWSWS